jgi:hypothetical protein
MKKNIIAGLLFIAFGAGAVAGMHFSFTPNTGNNMTVLVKESSVRGLETGDEIGAFINGRCVGATMWEGKNAAITVWGDNEQTSVIDGAKPGGKIGFKVWKRGVNREYAAEALYEKGKPFYSPDGIAILSGLNTRGEGKQGDDRTAGDNSRKSDTSTVKVTQKEFPKPGREQKTVAGIAVAAGEKAATAMEKGAAPRSVAAVQGIHVTGPGRSPESRNIEKPDSAGLFTVFPPDSMPRTDTVVPFSLYPDSYAVTWQPDNDRKKRYRLAFTLPKPSEVVFKISNSSGKPVYRLKETMQAGGNSVEISVDTLAKGAYTYDLKTETYSVSGKFLLEK